MIATRVIAPGLLALLTLGGPFPLRAAEAGANPAQEAAGPVLDRAEFVRVLESWSTTLRAFRAHPEGVTIMRAALPPAWKIQVDDRRYDVPTGWLDRGLQLIENHPESRACVARDLRARLAALRAEAGGAGAVSLTPPLAPARARLDTILSAREFRGIGPPGALSQLIERLLERIRQFLRRFSFRLGLEQESSQALLWVLIAVALAVAAVGLLRVLGRNAPRRAAAPAAPEAPGVLTWRAAADLALRAAREGAHGEALRLAYAAALLRIEEIGLWDLDAARTHREYLRLLPAGHELRPPFQALAGRFEMVVYGHHPATHEDVMQTVGLLERLEWATSSTPATGRS